MGAHGPRGRIKVDALKAEEDTNYKSTFPSVLPCRSRKRIHTDNLTKNEKDFLEVSNINFREPVCGCPKKIGYKEPDLLFTDITMYTKNISPTSKVLDAIS